VETITLKIKGMTCGGCVKSVTKVLQNIAGVSGVNVSLEQNTAMVSYDPAMATPAQFKSAIEDAGYEVV